MTDDQFERELEAAVLARDPGPSSPALMQRLAAIPDREPSTMAARARRAMSRFVQPAAAVVALSALLALVLMWRPSFVPSQLPPGVGANPGSAAFDPTVDGAGVYAGSEGSEIVAILIVASMVTFLAVVRVRPRAFKAVAVGAAVAVVLGAVTVYEFDELESTGIIWYAGLGAVADSPPDEGSLPEGERPSQAFIVEPNGVFSFGFDIHNRGPFPITVLGIVPDGRDLAFGRFTAAGWMGGDDGVSTVEPERFAPLTLQPDGYQVLAVAARASACAIARDTTHDAFGAGAGVEVIQVAYEVVGIRKVATLQLPEVVRISVDPNCGRDDVVSSPAP
jgi:hypothetical protein